MHVIRHLLLITILLQALLSLGAASALAQRPDETVAEREGRLARRSGGVRVGRWNVDIPADDTTEVSRSLHFEIYFQRGLDERVAIENSLAAWLRVTEEVQTLPLGGQRIVETRSYVVPLITSLKFYPLTTTDDFFEPYIRGGVGFALGVIREAENAIGGGGTSIATGFGITTSLGVEVHVTRALGLLAAGRFQWLRFGEDLGSQDQFAGAGFEGGLTYRFQF